MSTLGFGAHIKIHGYSGQMYYDTFLKKPNEGICIICGKPTQFDKITTGYNITCSYECASKNKESKIKAKETCLKKYGVENPSQLEEIKKKKEQTCISNYGTKYYIQSEIGKIKIKETCIEKYGVENPSQLEEIKQKKIDTCLKHYGVEYSINSPIIKNKIEQTVIKKYGVKNVSQNTEIHKKQMYGKYHAPNGKVYDSSWEYLFEQYLIEKKIPYVYQADITLVWTDVDGKEHRYIPDFSIITDKQELIEIKGDHFIENGVLIDPYNKTEKGYANARLKWECMQKAGVKVYTSKELKELGILK